MLERLQAQVGEHPKLDEWQPPLCGDIDIQIDSQGQWHSLGEPFVRERLVRLFASVLRCESDGNYYLVTPVEKWRIVVDDLPFQLTDLVERDGSQWLIGPLGIECPINENHPWKLIKGLPAVKLWHGNWGRISRSLYYQLAERVELRENHYGLVIAGCWCVLGKNQPD